MNFAEQLACVTCVARTPVPAQAAERVLEFWADTEVLLNWL